MTIYIYSNETGKQVGHHTAQSVTDCENWANANYGNRDYHWFYIDQLVSDRHVENKKAG